MILANALKSISRSKGRNILIGIIVLTIAASSCVALAIQNAAESAKTAGLDAQTITGTIAVDREKLMERVQEGGMETARTLMQEYTALSLDDMKFYADSQFVKDFYYTSNVSLNASGQLSAYGAEESDSSDGDASNSQDGNVMFQTPQQFNGGGGRSVMIAGAVAIGDFSVTGYSSEAAMTKFISGESQITDGAMFDTDSADMMCLISNEVAVLNGISVGDTITLESPITEGETYTLTVSGIYTNTVSNSDSSIPQFFTAMDPANLIYVSAGTIDEITAKSSENATVETNEFGMESSSALTAQTSGVYVFANSGDYASFGGELTERGLSEFYALSSSDIANYEASLVPLQNLSGFASTLLAVVLIVGAVILVVINVFNIRERKYEVGVLTAIGIKKYKVAAQFVTELMCVTLAAVVVGTCVGAVISVPVANNLLDAQITSIESSQSAQEQNFGRGGMPITAGGNRQGGAMMSIFGGNADVGDVEYLDTVNATVSFAILLQLIGIGVLLTVFSSLAGIVFVLRYDPLKILASRS